MRQDGLERQVMDMDLKRGLQKKPQTSRGCLCAEPGEQRKISFEERLRCLGFAYHICTQETNVGTHVCPAFKEVKSS